MATKVGLSVPLLRISFASRIADSFLEEAAILKKMMVVMVMALGLVMSASAFASDYGKQAA